MMDLSEMCDLTVAAGAAAVHAKAAPDFVDRFFVSAELVRISANQHDVVVGDIGTNQDFALAGLSILTGRSERGEAVVITQLFRRFDLNVLLVQILQNIFGSL